MYFHFAYPKEVSELAPYAVFSSYWIPSRKRKKGSGAALAEPKNTTKKWVGIGSTLSSLFSPFPISSLPRALPLLLSLSSYSCSIYTGPMPISSPTSLLPSRALKVLGGGPELIEGEAPPHWLTA
jgi:hypothetical protein